jgi:hypothetical protein
VFKANPIPKHMNGNKEAVRIIDLIQLLPNKQIKIVIQLFKTRERGLTQSHAKKIPMKFLPPFREYIPPLT